MMLYIWLQVGTEILTLFKLSSKVN